MIFKIIRRCIERTWKTVDFALSCTLCWSYFSYPNVHFCNCFFSPQVMIWAHLQLRLQISLRGCLSSQGKHLYIKGKMKIYLNITNLWIRRRQKKKKKSFVWSKILAVSSLVFCMHYCHTNTLASSSLLRFVRGCPYTIHPLNRMDRITCTRISACCSYRSEAWARECCLRSQSSRTKV